jgi:membrane-bound lytic murein transglycosylase B
MRLASAWPPAWLVLALSLPTAAFASAPESYTEGARAFAAEMADKHGLDLSALEGMLAQAEYRQDIIDAMRRPAEGKPWHAYRPIFLTPTRVAGGVQFMHAHRDLLQRAEAEHGVPPEIIAAVIGVETNYGSNQGRYRVIDALTTLGFAYPERAGFFRNELEELLLLSRDERLDPLGVKGSYAGAMGMPQFIPSSYRDYAIDFDGDGHRDLWHSPADAIGSVANYFSRHGWRAGEPVTLPVQVAGTLPADIPVLEKAPAEPNLAVKKLIQAGITASEPLPAAERVSLIRLEAPEDEYWLGFNNFYVITRYNHSNLYAMAVYQLSREIRETFRAED